jgi:hypothetical protein
MEEGGGGQDTELLPLKRGGTGAENNTPADTQEGGRAAPLERGESTSGEAGDGGQPVPVQVRSAPHKCPATVKSVHRRACRGPALFCAGLHQQLVCGQSAPECRLPCCVCALLRSSSDAAAAAASAALPAEVQRDCSDAAQAAPQDAGPVQVHAAAAALQALSTEAAELLARLAELATPLTAPLPDAVAATLEHLARPGRCRAAPAPCWWRARLRCLRPRPLQS